MAGRQAGAGDDHQERDEAVALTALSLAMAVILISSAVQGSVGFGANVLAMPLLLLIDPAFVPAPALLAGFGINVLMLARDRHAASLGPVSNALVGRVFGTVIGVAALGAVGDRGLAVLVAGMVLAVVAANTFGFSAERTARNMVAAGVVSGFGASTAGIGGPPVALLFQDATGPQIRGSLGAFFVVGNVISLTGMAIGGLFGWEELRLGLILSPAAFLGFAATRWIVPIVDNGYAKPAILSLSSLAAVALIGRLILG